MLLLFEGIHLLVLVWYTFLLQRNPDTLVEGTELDEMYNPQAPSLQVKGVANLTHPE